MFASLRAFFMALILTGALGSLALDLPQSVLLLCTTAAAALAVFPIIWIVVDAASPPAGRLQSAVAHLAGWLLAPVLGPSGHIMIALPVSLLWPIGNLFEAPLLTGDVWSWGARIFLAALAAVLFWAVECALSLRAHEPAAEACARSGPAACEAPRAPARRAPIPAGPTQVEQEILRRLDALQSAVARLDNHVNDMAAWCASQDLHAAARSSLVAPTAEAGDGPSGGEQSDNAEATMPDVAVRDGDPAAAEARKPTMLSRPGKDSGRVNILDLFDR